MSEQFYLDTRLPIYRTRWRSNPAPRVDLTRQTSGVQRLIAELDRDMALLDESIAIEEAATGTSDLTNFRYSLAARGMRTRRDNLASTKVALLERLTHL
jgi:hypothetical protein